MDIKIFCTKKYNIKISDLKETVLKICNYYNLTGYIGINFVSEQKIQKYNEKYLKKEEPTDVLSFSTKTRSKNQVFGEILISPEIAEKEKITIQNLVIHGLTHLIGFDHENNQENWNKELKKISRIIS